jgi:Fe-S cluster assembly iron-binding protein IscA
MITITEAAAVKIRELTPDEMQEKYALRMRVVGGGCSGLQ